MIRAGGFWKLLRDDLGRLQEPSVSAFLIQYFMPRGGCFPYVFWLRVNQFLRRGGVVLKLFLPFAYLIFRHFEFKYGIHANANIEIDGGLCVVHGGNVYLNCERIGRNFTVYQGVTLGKQAGGRPEVEDNVTIYPNAIVVGGVRLENGCCVGALSYVSHDVAAGSTVVGAPARNVAVS